MNKKKLKKILLKLIPEYIFALYKEQDEEYCNQNISFSQEGEDLILARFFENKKEGFYIDVGAHNPIRFSNTHFFYKLGWRGINIDAMPGSMELFNKLRKRDINLEIAISDKKEELTYYAFNEPALNGFSKEISMKRNEKDDVKIIFEKKIKCNTLSEVLNIYLPANQKIDFMSVDVEGLDLNVLRSNNWERFRPQIILVEDLENNNLSNISNSHLYKFFADIGYDGFAKSCKTLFFKEIKHNERKF